MGTREAIRAEFMRMYAQERLDRITVKGLCAAVPVARTTFYAHYRNVDDVLAEVEDELLAGLAEVTERISGGDLPHMDFGTFLDETLGFIRGRCAQLLRGVERGAGRHRRHRDGALSGADCHRLRVSRINGDGLHDVQACGRCRGGGSRRVCGNAEGQGCVPARGVHQGDGPGIAFGPTFRGQKACHAH